MDQVLKLIFGYELITDWFGCWPSFHDAEIHWIKLQQKVPVQAKGASVEMLVQVWEIINDI